MQTFFCEFELDYKTHESKAMDGKFSCSFLLNFFLVQGLMESILVEEN